RLRHPGTVDAARPEGVRGDLVVAADDGHVALPAQRVDLPAAPGRPVEEGDVLRVAELRGRDPLALDVLHGADPVRVDHQLHPAGRRTADDPQVLAAGLDVSVDRGGGADPADVDGAGVERLDLGGARVE